MTESHPGEEFRAPEGHQDQPEEHQHRVSKRTALAVAGVLLVGGGTGAAALAMNRSGDDNQDGPAGTGVSASVSDACKTIEFTDAAANPQTYLPEAFLPKGPAVSAAGQEVPYVAGLFDADGPAAGKADLGTVAVLDALITEPSRDHAVFDPKRSLTDAFDKAIQKYEAGDAGRKKAAEDCVTTNRVMVETGEFESSWVQNGANITAINAVHGDSYKIGRHLAIQNTTADKTMYGIVWKLRPGDTDNDDFGEVFESFTPGTEGRLFMKGVTLEDNNGKPNENAGVVPTPSPTPSPVTGNTTQSDQGGSAAGITTGNNPENNPAPIPGRVPEAGTGDHNSPTGVTGPVTGPNTGGGGGGEKPPVVTQPPVVTKPPVVIPPVETPPPTTPPTTKGTKGSEPTTPPSNPNPWAN
jgi:hypothetical protein